MGTKTKSKAVVKAKSNLPAVQNVARGFEDMEQEDFTMPYAKITQKLSPELEDDNISCKTGDILNSISKHNYGPELIFIPILFGRRRIKWIPRSDGGGMECGSRDGKSPDTGAKFSPFCADCEHSQWDNENSKPPSCDMYRVFPSIVLDGAKGKKKVEGGAKIIAISFAKSSALAGKGLLNNAKYNLLINKSVLYGIMSDCHIIFQIHFLNNMFTVSTDCFCA